MNRQKGIDLEALAVELARLEVGPITTTLTAPHAPPGLPPGWARVTITSEADGRAVTGRLTVGTNSRRVDVETAAGRWLAVPAALVCGTVPPPLENATASIMAMHNLITSRRDDLTAAAQRGAAQRSASLAEFASDWRKAVDRG